MKVKQRPDYTFKYNENLGRHGWLRLTPAYSVKLVEEIIDDIHEDAFILDPFSGTATTGLVAAEHGLNAHCFDINPFLVWLGNAKCRNYTEAELSMLEAGVDKALAECETFVDKENWLPDMHNITRWWAPHTLKVLAALRQTLVRQFNEPKHSGVSSLVWIAFCRLVIETSSAAFNHVSMSFQEDVVPFELGQVRSLYLRILDALVQSVSSPLTGSASVYLVDSREPVSIRGARYSHVITSPPYPNRISYVRELRPYMYWTKFLANGREAGELDWQSIGGTWGIATSRLQDWEPNRLDLPQPLEDIVRQILGTGEKNASLMAKYVWKYFHDMHLHLQNLRRVLKEGAVLAYIVGNSSFYGVQVHTQELLESSLKSLGFSNVGSDIVRKRNSKKELFEYCVYATWKERRTYVPVRLGMGTSQAKQLTLF